jgi:TPR repeat protein
MNASANRLASLALILALCSLPTGPLAQVAANKAPAPAAAKGPAVTGSAEVQAALAKAQMGDTAPLLKLADGGDLDAQYYAGEMFLFGRGGTPKDGARGCAYEEKASVKRADAMHLLAMCYQSGAGGVQDSAKAEAAFLRAADMGFTKSRCALGQILLADPKQAQRGLDLCKQSANAGDPEAQEIVGNAYFAGTVGGKPNLSEARKWYEKAAAQNNPNAARRLGEMLVRGDGGRKDTKKAVSLWVAAEKAGDPLVAILVADQMFSDLTGGQKPGPGKYAFRGGVPTGELEVIEQWYQLAEERDPRPEVKARAKYAIQIIGSLKSGAVTATQPKTKG